MNIREQAVKTLLRIEKDGAYSNLETRAVLKRFEVKAEDRGLYLNLVYGVLQKKLWLDAVLNCYVKKGVAKLDAEVRIILELALYQIYELDRVPFEAKGQGLCQRRASQCAAAPGTGRIGDRAYQTTEKKVIRCHISA